MAKKKKTGRPSETPLPAYPEIVPEHLPEEPQLPSEPEITPEEDPDEPEAPSEFPKTY